MLSKTQVRSWPPTPASPATACCVPPGSSLPFLRLWQAKQKKPRPPQYWSEELGWSQVCTQKAASGKERLGTGRCSPGSGLRRLSAALPHVCWPPALCSQPRSVWATVVGPRSLFLQGHGPHGPAPAEPQAPGPRGGEPTASRATGQGPHGCPKEAQVPPMLAWVQAHRIRTGPP